MNEQFNDRGPFKIGEVCVIVRDANHRYPELIGLEVTITGPCEERISGSTGLPFKGYKTDLLHKGMRICPLEDSLRRRKPPAKYTGEERIAEIIREAIATAPKERVLA